MKGLKLPSLKGSTPLTPSETELPQHGEDGDDDDDADENKSNRTSETIRSIDPIAEERAKYLLLGLPPSKSKKPNKDGIRKPPPHPDSLMGKAFACYHKYHDRYVALVRNYDEQFTQIAREDALEAKRWAAMQHTPPSTVASPRMEGTLEDVIDLCKSRVRAGKVKRLRKLVNDNCIDVNQCSTFYGGWTPAIACARAGATKTLQVLVNELGADVNVCEMHNWSPLMFAAYRGHVQTVRYLVVTCRADRTIRCKGMGWTAQMYARRKAFPHTKHGKESDDHKEIVSILKGDTPHHTPRGAWGVLKGLEFRSLLFAHKRGPKIEAEKIASVNCWCMNLEVRCKKCQYKMTNKSNAEQDEERSAFLKRTAEEQERKRKLFGVVPGGGSSDSSDSESESESESDDDV